MTKYTRIFLVRHGQTEWNMQNRLQGQKDSLLTEAGKEQALHVQRLFSGVTLHKAYVSPLPRALATAHIILDGRDTLLIETNNLKEINLGPWEGKTREETQGSHPEQYEYFWNKPERFWLEGAETYEQLQARVVQELDDIFCNNQSRNVLVVCHWIAIKVALAHYLSEPLNRLSSIADPGNGSFIVLTQSEDNTITLDTGR